MKTFLLQLAIASGLVLSACTTPDKQHEQTKSVTNEIKTAIPMKNLISIVEIPTTEFSRAVTFYEAILGSTIEEVVMDGIQMGIVSGEGDAVSVALLKGNDYKPASAGVIVYLNAGEDLQPTLDKVEKNGGKIVVPKTLISPDMGYFALFIDTEGNKLGLHSSK